MMFEIDLGEIGIYDAKIKAICEKVRGIDEVIIESVDIILPVKFEGRNEISVNIAHLLTDAIKLDIAEAFLLHYHFGQY